MKYLLFTACLCIGLLSSCSLPSGKEEALVPKPVSYVYLDSSFAFRSYEAYLRLDSADRMLRIELGTDLRNKAQFAVLGKDTLTETAFLVEVFADGKPLLSCFREKDYYDHVGDMQQEPDTLRFHSDTVDLSIPQQFYFHIPFYAFHRLRHGAHRIEVRVSQTVFRSDEHEIVLYDSLRKEKYSRYEHFRAERKLVYATAAFRLTVPALYHANLYMNRIVIRNDSVYSALSADNTLWKSPLPDVYWKLKYPESNTYHASVYEKSTIEYTRPDTVTLYYYNGADSLSFMVYDHDNLSKDDFLGYGTFCIKDLMQHRSFDSYFGYVKLFSLRAAYKGPAN